MSEQISTTTTARSGSYDDVPLSLLLFRYIWPFWLFRNASSGDRLSRAAAYRHNRGMRVHLPGYLLKWLVSGAVALAMTHKLAALAPHMTDSVSIFTLMAAGAGVLFTCAFCVLFVTAYLYCYLCRNES